MVALSKNISSVICGIRSAEQLNLNKKAVNVNLNKNDLKNIEKLYNNILIMKFDNYIEQIYKNNPSLNFCVFNINGDIIYEYSRGYQDLNKNKIVKKDTKYGIGSITKLFTTIAILQLIDKNQLSFNDSIHKF